MVEVAFPFKSPVPLVYAELMQDVLRQWGNTAERCSLCCQQASVDGEEGERTARRREGQRERERERGRERGREGEREGGGEEGMGEGMREREGANNVILFRRHCCSQLYHAMKAHQRRPRRAPTQVHRTFSSSCLAVSPSPCVRAIL